MMSYGEPVVRELPRLTQTDWCNAPQPGNWANACMRNPGHNGDHAVRKSYRPDEAWFWVSGASGVAYKQADFFPDLWDVDSDIRALFDFMAGGQ